jgi:hypothetical protein
MSSGRKNGRQGGRSPWFSAAPGFGVSILPKEESKSVSRRRFVAAALARVPLALSGQRMFAQAATTLKIAHQFPGATGNEGDYRDRLYKHFAADVENRTFSGLMFVAIILICLVPGIAVWLPKLVMGAGR